MNIAAPLFSTVLLLTACGEFTGELPAEPKAFAPYANVPGRLGVSIHGADSRVWRFQIAKGQVSAVDTLPSAPRSATSVGAGLERPPEMPQRGDLAPRGPFAYSPDKAYLVAAMDLMAPRDSVPRNLAVLRVGERKIVYEGGDNQSSVEAVAWSPDSKQVAVLRRTSSERLKSPVDILSGMFGHPVQYSDYWIEVIGVDGKSLGRAQIASGAKASWGELVWTQ